MVECKICGHISKNSRGRNTHLRFKHPEISVGEYYEKYYPNYCKVCNSLIKFKGEKYEQYVFCSKKCQIQAFKENPIFVGSPKKYKEDFLLNILKELYKKYKGYVTQRMVKEDGRVKPQIYYSYFGGFSKACDLADVPNLHKLGPRKHFKEDVINKVKEIYKKTKCKISWQLILENSNLNKKAILQFFNSIGQLCAENNIPYNLEDKMCNDKCDVLTTILIDNRERKPYKFNSYEFTTLNIGDYRSKNFFNGVIFERKSMGDLKSTMSGGNNTKRFSREMDRARKEQIYVLIIIDCSKNDFFKKHPYGRNTNNGIYHLIKMFGSVYADVCQFIFTGSRNNSIKIIDMCQNWFPEDLRDIDLQLILDSTDDENFDIFSSNYIQNPK